jgi:adenylate cyclase 1
MLPGGAKRRPSFKMVSNMVIQLLHSIKYSVEVPFSNMAQQPVDIQKGTLASSNNPNKKVRTKKNKTKNQTFYF